MIDYREIIRLKSADYSNTSVASSTGSSRNKVADIRPNSYDIMIDGNVSMRERHGLKSCQKAGGNHE